MNEQIRKLHRQVMLWNDTPDCPDKVEWGMIPEEYTKKLAELIVKECTNMLPDDSIRNEDGVHMFYVMRDHFGVSTSGR